MPKDIFGGSQSTQPSQAPSRKRPSLPARPSSQISAPPVPGVTIKKTPEPTKVEPPKEEVDTTVTIDEPEPVVDLETQDDDDAEHLDTIEEQLLGKPAKKKSLGLSKKKQEEKKPVQETKKAPSTTSEKARELIESSFLRAAKPQPKPQEAAPIIETPKIEKTEVKKTPQRKFRNKVSSYQPANRARRLDRSRHMEYKYEMRGILVDLGVPEEHRSNLLATIWARGERQNTDSAKEFIAEKMDEGVIDDEQQEKLVKIVDGYTVRR